jgi:DNA-binding GntR family transcriptional regulator
VNPLDTALARLGRAVLAVLYPGLARRAAAELDEAAAKELSVEVDRLTDLLTMP